MKRLRDVLAEPVGYELYKEQLEEVFVLNGTMFKGKHVVYPAISLFGLLMAGLDPLYWGGVALYFAIYTT